MRTGSPRSGTSRLQVGRLASGIVLLASVLVAPPARAADPTVQECLSANVTSITLRNQHKLGEARAELLVCAAPSCPEDIRLECVRRVRLVNAAIPMIVFQVKDPSGNDLAAVTVTMDGKPLVDRLDGTALSLDPGEHRFSFTAAGRPTVERTFILHEGEQDRRERIVLANAPEAPALAPAPAPAGPPPVVVDRRPSGMGTARIAGATVAGIGLAGVVVGAVFGLSAKSRYDESNKDCGKQPGDPNGCESTAGVTLRDEARTAGTISTVAFIVGGVGLAAGAVLWFTAPRGTKATIALGPASIRLGAAW